MGAPCPSRGLECNSVEFAFKFEKGSSDISKDGRMPTLRTTGISKPKNGRPETPAPPVLERGGSNPQALRESSTGSIGYSTPASRRKSVGVQPASATKRPATGKRRQSNANAGMAKDRVSCIVRKRPAKASEVRPPAFNADTQQTDPIPGGARRSNHLTPGCGCCWGPA